MKRLYLIRHAKSRKDIPGIKDEDRPLSKRGEKDARYIGARLKKLGFTAEVFYSSPAKRAFDTAKIIAKKTGFPRKKIKKVNLIYDSNILKLIRVIKKIDDTAGSAAVFGHNPEFLKLVNYLTPLAVKNFPTCGVFGIEFPADSWTKAARKKGTLVMSVIPKRGH